MTAAEKASLITEAEIVELERIANAAANGIVPSDRICLCVHCNEFREKANPITVINLLATIRSLKSTFRYCTPTVDAMYEALKKVEEEWPHNAPTDCYLTVPLTGDLISDHVACPGCALSKAVSSALALYEKEKERG